MNIVFMNLENSKYSDPHRLVLNLANKIGLKRCDKYVALSNISIYYTKFNILDLPWSEKFTLSDGSI